MLLELFGIIEISVCYVPFKETFDCLCPIMNQVVYYLILEVQWQNDLRTIR